MSYYLYARLEKNQKHLIFFALIYNAVIETYIYPLNILLSMTTDNVFMAQLEAEETIEIIQRSLEQEDPIEIERLIRSAKENLEYALERFED